MSAAAVGSGTAQQGKKKNYLNADHTLRSWLTTTDHKRIAVLYLFSVTFYFLIGGIAAGLIRYELTSPHGILLSSEAYNKMFSAHGAVMVFQFLIPGIPAVFGNFLIPLMIGARDLAFPRLNLVSWYMYMVGGGFILLSTALGGIDAGWTFYVPLSTLSKTQISLALVGAFITGFSSIFTGINFIVTIHKMRAPGMTWYRMPLFCWGHYATSIIIILGTPVVAITLLLVVLERLLGIGIFSPELGGDPVLFQHLFWFYSHPAVYIMILPSMGVVSELITCFSRRTVFGYRFVAYSSLAIAFLGFLVWGHHMYISSQSVYQGLVFSVITFILAVPSAIKVFNWCATMWKGSVHLVTPMIYAIAFLGLFVIGGLTGTYLASTDTDVGVTGTYFIVAHFHYVMVGGTILGYLGALHFWWPKMFGVTYSEFWGRISALLVFVGFNLTFFPQFILGYLGMPRRYHYYYFQDNLQFYNILSTGGSMVLGVGFALPVVYLGYSLFRGKPSGQNPWGAKGLEWENAASPPITENFDETPLVTGHVYDYNAEEDSKLYEDQGTEVKN